MPGIRERGYGTGWMRDGAYPTQMIEGLSDYLNAGLESCE